VISKGNNEQKEWERKSRAQTIREVELTWLEEQRYRKKYGKPKTVGYEIIVGKNCSHARVYDGLTFLIEDVYDEPDLLPPYEGCRYETCECTYRRATSARRKKARIVLEFGNAELQAKLTTRYKSPVGFEHTSAGGPARSLRAKASGAKRTGNAIRSSTPEVPRGCASPIVMGLVLLTFLFCLCAAMNW